MSDGGGGGAIAMSDGGRGGDRNIRIIDADSSFGGARRGGRTQNPLEPPLVVTNWLLSFEIQGY